jgi:hypothetical protein
MSVPESNQPSMLHHRLYQKINIYCFVVTLLLAMQATAAATDLFSTLKGNHTYESYYEIVTDTKGPISTLTWRYQQDPQFSPPEAYKRSYHFGGWIKDPSNASCFDVRGLVLIRQALTPVTVEATNSCRIYSASWYDPYSDEYFHLASDLQIDHVVPLKNAYLAGGWDWSQAKRCNYSNFMGYEMHLLAVQSHANLSKGDRGPDAYFPINSQFQCQYVAMWLRIKAYWHLKLAIPEANAIQQFLTEHQCPAELFSVNGDEFLSVEAQTEAAPEACLNR